MTRNDLNAVASRGFEEAATLYEQARPSYPNEVIDLVKSLSNKPNTIIDLGAGTGKLTRLLGPIGAREIVAIEPVSAMREKLKNIPIITKIIDGTAEHIPFEDNTIDMIICAQSFHWFANHCVLTEFNRVLKSNGLLVLIWNVEDSTGREWADNVFEYVDSFRSSDTPQYKEMEWIKVFDNQNLFSSLQYRQFAHTRRVTRELVLNRILSKSFIAALSADQKAKLIDNVQRMLENVEEIRNFHEFDILHLTNVYWCSALKSSS